MSCLAEEKMQQLNDIANKIRIHSIDCTQASNSGHPTSSCSAAEIMSVLFFHTMRYKAQDPKNPKSDRFVLSKGHSCPALYGAWVETGLLTREDLLTLRKITSDIEGHPTPRLNFIDVGTGSLGMGLSFACGMAYVGKYIDHLSHRTYCVLGDGETAEGAIWEAMHFAWFYKLDNLCAIIDCNRLGQSDPTSLQHDIATYCNRVRSFGWHCIAVDGHSVKELVAAFTEAANTRDKPTCLVAKTFKGRGIPDVEDLMGWHGKPLGAKAESAIAVIKARIVNHGPHGLVAPLPEGTDPVCRPCEPVFLSGPPQYKKGDKVATRSAYGTGLLNLGKKNSHVIVLDGDVKNSSMSQTFQKQFPDRFVECYIAEQNMVGVGIGAATRDRTIVFVSTFAAFLSRAYDQLRMGAISFTKANFCGSHAGCSIGADGPSQMALEDLAMFRAIPNCTVFYPSDAVSTERAVELAANTNAMTFIRTTRAATPVIYDAAEPFGIGKAKVVRKSDTDKVTVIGAGITLFEALKAADLLAAEGINVCVIDPFTIKPLDVATIIECARRTGGRILTVEDHYYEGGLGEAVASGIGMERNTVLKRLAVKEIPRSGEPDELIAMFGLDSVAICSGVKEIMTL